MELDTAFQQTANEIGAFLPELAAFLLIVVVGYFIAKGLAKLTDRLLEGAGFDRVVRRSRIGNSIRKANYEPSDLLANIVKYAVMLFTLQLGFGVFGPNPVSAMLNDIVAYLPLVFAAILIVVIAGAIATAVRDIVDASIGGLSYGRTLANIAAGVVTAVGIFAALDVLNVAPMIVTGLFYAALAIIAGVTIVAVGGGGIAPMRSRWENVLTTYDNEKDTLKSELEGSSERIKQRAQARQQQIAAGVDIDLRDPVLARTGREANPSMTHSPNESLTTPSGDDSRGTPPTTTTPHVRPLR